MFPIGEVAKRTGIKVPTIRYYEGEGLVAPPRRTESGRRLYAEADVRRLSFIRHARTLGFEIDDIRSLLDLSDKPQRPCEEADRIARTHLATVNSRIEQLTRLRSELKRMVAACAGGSVADCRVIDTLADHSRCLGEHQAFARRPQTKKATSRTHRRA